MTKSNFLKATSLMYFHTLYETSFSFCTMDVFLSAIITHKIKVPTALKWQILSEVHEKLNLNRAYIYTFLFSNFNNAKLQNDFGM